MVNNEDAMYVVALFCAVHYVNMLLKSYPFWSLIFLSKALFKTGLQIHPIKIKYYLFRK